LGCEAADPARRATLHRPQAKKTKKDVKQVFDRLADLVSEHAELEQALADPGVHADQEKARTLGRRYAELTPIVRAYQEWQQTSGNEGRGAGGAAGGA
jgi:phage host-nuclease inhibitor protein Gam